MTLIRQLDAADSPMRTFLSAMLPNTAAVRPVWRRALADAETVRPAWSQPGGYPYDEVGHGIGVRLRLAIARTKPGDLVHEVRPAILARWSAVREVVEDAEGLVAALAPNQRWPSAAEEPDLARYCYVLGLLDQMYRVGPRPDLRIMALPPDALASAFLGLARPECIDDMCALARIAVVPLAEFDRETVAAGPTFAGSADVGGADADLVAGGCLIEIKAKVKPGFEQRTLHQVLAYALLDYDDTFHIDTVAIYMARQGRTIRFALDELVPLLAAAPTDVATVRRALARHLASRQTIARPERMLP